MIGLVYNKEQRSCITFIAKIILRKDNKRETRENRNKSNIHVAERSPEYSC